MFPPGAGAVQAEEAAPQVVLAETYNAVTKIHFTNIAVHKGSHKPGLVERRFRADVKYWLMDAKYYDGGELSIGNPPLVELVRKLGSKDLPETNRQPFPRWHTGSLGSVGAVSHHPKRSKSPGSFLQGIGAKRRGGRQPCGESRFAALNK